MSILWNTWHSVFTALCKWTQRFSSSQVVWIIAISESSDLWRTPTFPSHIPPSTEVSLSHRSLSCPLGLLLCFMVPAISSITQWPSSPSGYSVPHSSFLGLTDHIYPIGSQLPIAFPLSWAHLSDTSSPSVLAESKLTVPPPFPTSRLHLFLFLRLNCSMGGVGLW